MILDTTQSSLCINQIPRREEGKKMPREGSRWHSSMKGSIFSSYDLNACVTSLPCCANSPASTCAPTRLRLVPSPVKGLGQ